jgi:hypothetical protein
MSRAHARAGASGLARPGRVETAAKVNFTNVFAGRNVAIGIVAHFFLVLVVQLVQVLLASTPHAGHAFEGDVHRDALLLGGAVAIAHHEAWTHWHLIITLLLSALMLVTLVYFTGLSWPILSEKALFIALLWMLYGAVAGNFGICLCCDDGPWAAACGGLWYRQLVSVLWVVVVAAAYLVDARGTSLRRAAFVFMLAAATLLVLAPLNSCNALSAQTLIVFLKITVFHLLWHGNRVQRIVEATIYSIIARNVRALQAVQVSSDATTPAGVASVSSRRPDLDTPSDLLNAWSVMRKLAEVLDQGDVRNAAWAPDGTGRAALLGTTAREPVVAKARTQQQLFVESVAAAARAMPALDDFAWFGDDESAPGDPAGVSSSRYVDWRYRNYSYQYMIAIDIVRAIWVLGVCWPYLLFAVFQLAWIYVSVSRSAAEIVDLLQSIHAEATRTGDLAARGTG